MGWALKGLQQVAGVGACYGGHACFGQGFLEFDGGLLLAAVGHLEIMAPALVHPIKVNRRNGFDSLISSTRIIMTVDASLLGASVSLSIHVGNCLWTLTKAVMKTE